MSTYFKKSKRFMPDACFSRFDKVCDGHKYYMDFNDTGDMGVIMEWQGCEKRYKELFRFDLSEARELLRLLKFAYGEDFECDECFIKVDEPPENFQSNRSHWLPEEGI